MHSTHSNARRFGLHSLGCAVLILMIAAGCSKSSDGLKNPSICVTIQPLAMVMREIVGTRLPVVCLLPPGVSPHTYDIRPSDAQTAENSKALFYVDDSLDGWSAKLNAPEKVNVFSLVPDGLRRAMPEHGALDDHDDHDHGPVDAHFWSDPTVVRALLPALVEQLSALDPDGASEYGANAKRFERELETLDAELATMLKPLNGKSVVQFHPSLNYFLARYGLTPSAFVEPSPGKEASPKYLNGVIDAVKASGAKAVFSEPQLAKRPAEIVAEAAGVTVLELDPNGGVDGRKTYAELLRYNAKTLLQAFE